MPRRRPVIDSRHANDSGSAPRCRRRAAFDRLGAAAQQPQVFLNINPSWSPDGRQLVFESARHGNTTLYIINADGTGERRLTSTGYGDDTHPAWSPDGRTILFDSSRDGAFHLYTIHPDGTDERRLTIRDTSAALMFAGIRRGRPTGGALRSTRIATAATTSTP